MSHSVRNDTTVPLLDREEVIAWAINHVETHVNNSGVIGPDFHVGPDNDHQLQRWFIVPRNPIANVYLHRFLRSDDDRALHDHPWDNRSWILSGEYVEHLADGTTETRFEGDVRTRKAIEAHRVELVTGPVLTLFFTGPIVRSWGFYCPNGWRHWQEFVAVSPNGNHRGRGCG